MLHVNGREKAEKRAPEIRALGGGWYLYKGKKVRKKDIEGEGADGKTGKRERASNAG